MQTLHMQQLPFYFVSKLMILMALYYNYKCDENYTLLDRYIFSCTSKTVAQYVTFLQPEVTCDAK